MQSWEYVVIGVGVAFIALCIYLIITLKKVQDTLKGLDDLVKDNTSGISDIVNNVNDISDNAKGLVSEATDKVTGLIKAIPSGGAKKTTNEPALGAVTSDGISDTFKSAVSAASFVYSAVKIVKNYNKERKIKKLLKQAKDATKKKAA